MLREILSILASLAKSCQGMGRRRMAEVLLGQSVRIRVGSFHACLIHGAHPAFEDDDGTLKIAVRGVAYEPACDPLSDRLPAARAENASAGT